MFSVFISAFAGVTWVISFMLGLSSTNLFMMWVSLELNLVSFVVLLSFSTINSYWVGMKYFLIQSAASGGFLFSSVWGGAVSSLMVWLVVVSCLLLKLGMAPFQFWLVNISVDLSWDSFLLISIFQKLIPLFALCSLFKGAWVMMIIFLGTMVSVLGGISCMLMKPFLVYSSVLGVSWMLSTSSFNLSFTFLSVYCLGFFVISLSDTSSSVIDKVASPASPSLDVWTLGLAMGLLSMSGMPPFVGFYAKAAVITSSLAQFPVIVPGALLTGSSLFIYMYISWVLFKVSWEGLGHSVFPLSTCAPAVASFIVAGSVGGSILLLCGIFGVWFQI